MSFFFRILSVHVLKSNYGSLLVSMKQKSPEVDIPKVFYSDIDGYNIYVKHKRRKTGLLKDILVIIFQMVLKNAHIIWAAEGTGVDSRQATSVPASV